MSAPMMRVWKNADRLMLSSDGKSVAKQVDEFFELVFVVKRIEYREVWASQRCCNSSPDEAGNSPRIGCRILSIITC